MKMMIVETISSSDNNGCDNDRSMDVYSLIVGSCTIHVYIFLDTYSCAYAYILCLCWSLFFNQVGWGKDGGMQGERHG